jgi:hypothetical protein
VPELPQPEGEGYGAPEVAPVDAAANDLIVRDLATTGRSALPPKADIDRRDGNVRFVPKPDSCTAAKTRMEDLPDWLLATLQYVHDAADDAAIVHSLLPLPAVSRRGAIRFHCSLLSQNSFLRTIPIPSKNEPGSYCQDGKINEF